MTTPTDHASSLRRSTLRTTSDVTSIVAFCSKTIEYFHGTASKFFFKAIHKF